MDIDYFSSLIKKTQKAAEQEQLWDRKAEDFNRVVFNSKNNNLEELMDLLIDRNIINSESKILDIGCGPGRHGMEFAKRSQSVVGLDISSKMLEFASENSKANNIVNTSYKKADWGDLDLKEAGWEKEFDFIFASMCPAIDGKGALEKMSKASKGYCMVSRMIKRQDGIAEEIINRFGIDAYKDPANGRETLWSFFNILWLMGYNPEMAYIERNSKSKLTKEEAIAHYSMRFSSQNLDDEIEKFINTLDDEKMNSEIYTNSALLYWKA